MVPQHLPRVKSTANALMVSPAFELSKNLTVVDNDWLATWAVEWDNNISRIKLPVSWILLHHTLLKLISWSVVFLHKKFLRTLFLNRLLETSTETSPYLVYIEISTFLVFIAQCVKAALEPFHQQSPLPYALQEVNARLGSTARTIRVYVARLRVSIRLAIGLLLHEYLGTNVRRLFQLSDCH